MLKSDALAFFDGVVRLSEAMEITHSAVSAWPEVLTRSQADRVRGAAVRLGKPLPYHMWTDTPSTAAEEQEPASPEQS